MEVRLGFNESFFFSSHFSLSYPKNSRYPFQKSIMPFSLYFYQIWHLFFLLPFVLLLILLKVFFFNFILRHFNSYNLFIQFDPYSFDCFFFCVLSLIYLFFNFTPHHFILFFYFGPYYFDYYFLIFFFIFLFFLSTFYFILFYYPILVLILFILFFLNFFFQFGP